VEDIYQALAPGIPTLSRTTVYNTLGLLQEKGLVRALRIGDAEVRYDVAMEEHFHFRCSGCGVVVDVVDDSLKGVLDALGRAALAGCVVRERQVYDQGICPKCAGKRCPEYGTPGCRINTIMEEMAMKRLDLYKCELCGNIVELNVAGGGALVCCGQEMGLLAENTRDAATEKHVPVIEQIAGGYKVTVGEVAHPMEEAHYIQWIELVVDNKAYTAFLKPGDKPEAVFMVEGSSVKAREYCNLHGHWTKEA
jgi:superoxide reductase